MRQVGLVVAWGALWLALTAAASAAEGRLGVDATLVWDRPQGFSPVQLVVDSDRARQFSVTVSAGATTGRSALAIPAGRSVHEVMLPPRPGSDGDTIDVSYRSDDGHRGGERWIHQQVRDTCPLVVVDPGGRIDHSDLETHVSRLYHAHRYGSDPQRLDVRSLPRHWQAYPSERPLVLTGEAVADLDDEQVLALRRWQRCGGRLLVAGGGTDRLPGAEVVPSEAGALARAVFHVHRSFSPRERLVPGTDQVPVGWFAALVVTFAILVGPLNIWWAVRSGQRWRVLASTPILSGGACLLLIGTNLISEGVTPRRVADQVVWLDSAEHEAVVWTGITWFAPFSAGSAELDPAVAVVAANPGDWEHDRHWRDVATELSGLGVDQAEVLRLSGPWVPSRVNRRWCFVEPRAMRHRLLVERSGEGYRITNGLPVAIQALRWQGSDGRDYRVDGALEPGTSAALVAEGADGAAGVELPHFIFDPGYERAIETLRTRSRSIVEARLAHPLVELPGFGGEDALPPRAWLVGPLEVTP